MSRGLRIVGVGEFHTFQEDALSGDAYYIRIMRGDGTIFDLPATAPQIELLVAQLLEGATAEAPPPPPALEGDRMRGRVPLEQERWQAEDEELEELVEPRAAAQRPDGPVILFRASDDDE